MSLAVSNEPPLHMTIDSMRVWVGVWVDVGVGRFWEVNQTRKPKKDGSLHTE